jgi:hypothetical protein
MSAFVNDPIDLAAPSLSLTRGEVQGKGLRPVNVGELADIPTLEDRMGGKLLAMTRITPRQTVGVDVVPWSKLSCVLKYQPETGACWLYFQGTGGRLYAEDQMLLDGEARDHLVDQILYDHRQSILKGNHSKGAVLALKLKTKNATGWLDVLLSRGGCSYDGYTPGSWNSDDNTQFGVFPHPLEVQAGIVADEPYAIGPYGTRAEAMEVGLLLLWRAVYLVALEHNGRRCANTRRGRDRLLRCQFVRGHAGACWIPDNLITLVETLKCERADAMKRNAYAHAPR